MANSKANIYPIQLQGAELCLNKFDAEIKQYSGFNKNNAPFVGGCLSNLFTKKTSISSSEINNIFVDSKENVYTVVSNYNECGLKKNGNFVIKYKAHNNDYFVSKLGSDGIPSQYAPADRKILPRYFLKVQPNYSEDVLKLVYRRGGAYLDYLTVDLETFTNKYVLDNLLYNCSTGTYYGRQSDGAFFFAYYHGHTKTVVVHIDGRTAITGTYTTSLTIDETYPISLMLDVTSGQISIAFKATDGHQYLDFYTVGTNTVDILANEVTTINNSTTYVMLGLDSWSFANYPACTGNLYKVGNNTFTANKLVGWVQYPYYDNSKINFRNTYRLNTPNITETKACTLFNVNKNGFISCYDMTIPVKASGESSYKSLCVHCNSLGLPRLDGFSLEDYTDENGLSIKKCTFVLGEQLPIFPEDLQGLYANFNNNQLTSVCTRNVLLSSWNDIDVRTVSCMGSNVYFVENGTFLGYSRTLGGIKLSVLGNQIVINIDNKNNAYDFVENKIKHFAPSYNNAMVLYDTETSSNLYSSSAANNVWIASGINEYKLQDNASALFNPVNVYVENLNTFKPRVYYGVAGKVNFYKGDLPANTKYIYSIEDELIIQDADLIDLPFPMDSNGNVTLSPNVFIEVTSIFGNQVLIKTGNKGYPLIINNDLRPVFSFYIGSEVENLQELFILQGQCYGLIDNNIYSMTYSNGVIGNALFVVSVENMQFCGQSPYQAIFYSPTNKCLYAFSGANILQKVQFVDKITEVYSYKYNNTTQTNMIFTDIGIIFLTAFGTFSLDYRAYKAFVLNNGICFIASRVENRQTRYYLLNVKYYLNSSDTDYLKENIKLETMFYGMDNQTVTINDCLYMRLFSEEHEEGEVRISATTISLKGRKTEETVFKYKSSDWDKVTHTIYMRYQPKTQRGLGISFNIESPFKIASMSVGSQPDAILVDKVSKGAITAPFNNNSSNIEW